MAAQMPVCIRYEDNFWDNLMTDEESSDTKIVVKNKQGESLFEFNLHSIVLRRRSKVFKRLITKIGETIVFEEVDLLMLKKFIKYLYVGEIYVENWLEISNLLKLSMDYGVDSLTSELEFSATKFVTLMNACDLLEISQHHKLIELEKTCLELIVRGAAVVSTTSGFLRLSESSMIKIISDVRLNVRREIDLLLSVVCWAKATSFTKGEKLDGQGVYQKIKTVLKQIRFDNIKDEEQLLVPENIRKFIFVDKNATKEEEKIATEVEKDEEEEDKDAIDEDKEKDTDAELAVVLEPRLPSKEVCLLSHYAEILLRPPNNTTCAWQSVGAADRLVMRFSVTMPIYLGGFLMYYRHFGYATARLIIRHSPLKTSDEVPVDTPFPLKHRVCEHRINNETIGANYYQAVCYEPETPILLKQGDECNVYLALTGSTVHETPRIDFPFTTFKTDEGPSFRLHLDNVSAVRKIYFLSACGRCLVTPND